MPKERKITLFLADILEAIGNIKTYTQNMDYDEFIRDRKTQDAVVRNLEVMGEAAKNIPDEVRRKYPEINWKAAAGMRDKLIHDYFGVSYQIVWETVTTDLPLFESQIRKALRNNRMK
ncbi:MAG: DUF86 domain-containing protein [Candidatus Heimdallarchaeota archaeon]